MRTWFSSSLNDVPCNTLCPATNWYRCCFSCHASSDRSKAFSPANFEMLLYSFFLKKRKEKCRYYPVAAEHLHAILVDDADQSGRLEPSLAVHLDWDAFVAQDGDLDRMALGDAVVLEVDDARRRHLDGTENGDHFQYAVVETGRYETVVLFIAAPEIRPAHKTIENFNSTFQWIKIRYCRFQVFFSFTWVCSGQRCLANWATGFEFRRILKELVAPNSCTFSIWID